MVKQSAFVVVFLTVRRRFYKTTTMAAIGENLAPETQEMMENIVRHPAYKGGDYQWTPSDFEMVCW